MIYEDEYSEVMAAFDKSPIVFCEYFKRKSELWRKFYKLKFQTFHYKLIKELLEFRKPKNWVKRLITTIIIARGHGKSKICSVLYPIWNIFMLNRDHIVLSSAAKGAKSIDNLTDIMRLIEDPAFLNIFPWEKGKWTPSQGTIEIIYKGRNILIRAIGIESAILGATWGESRIELFVGDDLEDPEIASSKERVDKAQNWISSVIRPGMSPDRTDGKIPGQMVMIGTYHGLDCLLARINSYLWKNITKIVKFPALVPIGAKKLAKRLDVQEDCSIWEDKFTTEYLHAVRTSYFLQGDESTWMMQYMCELVASKKKSFRPEYWQEINAKEAHKKLKEAKRMICTFDMAYTKGKASDAVGCTVAAHFTGSRMIIFRGTARKMSPVELYDLCLELDEEWYKLEMYGDSNALPYVMGYFYEKNIKHGANIEIYPFKIDDNKLRSAENMINALIPFYNTGYIEFVEGADTKVLQSQMFKWEGIKTKGDAIWDALESFGAQVLFLEATQLKTNLEIIKQKPADKMTAGDIADIYFKE